MTIFAAIGAVCLCVTSSTLANPPSSFDWRTHGAVGPVRNQGSEGNAGLIAAVASLESLHVISTGSMVRLSTQEVVDCCVCLFNLDCRGCINVGLHGLCSEADYPNSTEPGQCRKDSCTTAQHMSDWTNVGSGNEEELQKAVLHNPVLALINSSPTSFQQYKGGIYKDDKCDDNLDHAVLVVGYGTMNGEDYWICQNSWGKSWGMEGYIMIARNAGNMCGIASAASYPIM